MTKHSKHKGIETRIGIDGKISYRAKVRLKNLKATKTFHRLTDAVRWKQQTEADARRDQYTETPQSHKRTFGELIDRYIETVLPRKSNTAQKKQKPQLLWWKEQIGNKILKDVKTPLIVEIRDRFLTGTTYRGTKRSSATINRYLAVLSHVYSIAIDEWQWIKESPVKKLKLKESEGRIRYLSDEERDRLLKACKESNNKYLNVIVHIALATGLRQSEILELEYSRINWEKDNCLITIKDTKNGRPHCIPLVGIAKSYLAEHSKSRRLDTDLVFPATKGLKPRRATIRTAWEEALKKADVKDFNFHDLRHTAGSWLAQANISGPIIQNILNHKSSNITARYIHFGNNHIKDALEKMNDTFLASEGV